ncbi:MAG: hypothetical protein IVW52_19260 [Acidimicrobiales bacterium]|nr:hypothetical protein [Acidimicrobiales bacterium]
MLITQTDGSTKVWSEEEGFVQGRQEPSVYTVDDPLFKDLSTGETFYRFIGMGDNPTQYFVKVGVCHARRVDQPDSEPFEIDPYDVAHPAPGIPHG